MTSPSDLMTVTIDGVEVHVPKGTLIIRAAEEAGIQIPRFCDHPLLAPVAACRQCLVEVASPGPSGQMRAFPKPQPACAIPVADGMVVSTAATSETARRAQEAVMELMLLDHPLDCPICDKSGECPLQNQAMAFGRAATRFTGEKKRYPKPTALTAQILLDRERCVLCQRCTRFAEEIPGDPFIGLVMRGRSEQIGRVDPTAFASYFSGNIVEICPVGALTSASYRFRARPFDLRSTPSVGEHDASGAAIIVESRAGKVVRRRSGDDPEVNRLWLTDKDRFAFGWQQAPDRLTTPLIREDGELREASWPKALAAAAQGLGQARGVGVLPGGRLTLEDALAYSLFARAPLATNDIDYRWRARSREEAEFLASHVAGSGLGTSFADLASAARVVLAGFEPEEEGGVVFLRLREAAKAGSQILAIAPLASQGLKKLGGRLLPTIPGGEGEALDSLEADDAGATIIVVGERLAWVPGGLTAALRAGERLGAPVVWIPRRAGERAAIEAGLLGDLLPAGRSLADAPEVASAIGHPSFPTAPGRDLEAILDAAVSGDIDALLVGGVDLADLPEAAKAREAFSRAFTVHLEVRHSEAMDLADVVLPVAPPQEKAGTYLTWEGRRRPFAQALVSSTPADARVLQLIASHLGCDLDLGVAACHDLLARLGPPRTRAAAPQVACEAPPTPDRGEALLSTWREHLDLSRALDGEAILAATAKTPIALLAVATAKEIGLVEGHKVRISTHHGAIVLPARLAEMPERVVWAPMNSPGSRVLEALGITHGIVRIEAGEREVDG